jgi:tropomodulin
MTTRKLYGKDLSEYEKMDVDELLSQLTPEELDILSREVDPDVRNNTKIKIDRSLKSL